MNQRGQKRQGGVTLYISEQNHKEEEEERNGKTNRQFLNAEGNLRLRGL